MKCDIMVIRYCFLFCGAFSAISLKVERNECGCVVFVILIFGLKMASSGVFSLEDDDYGDLFITQKSNVVQESIEKDENDDSGLFLGVAELDFKSPCKKLIPMDGLKNAIYSDISEDEFD